MASLKEVKKRISSVNSTHKITLAMKMVASAKLHKAQCMAENVLVYEQKLESLLSRLLGAAEQLNSPFTQSHTSNEKVALVAIASNSGMCGGFNSNLLKEMHHILAPIAQDKLMLFPIGKKVRDSLEKSGYSVQQEYNDLVDHSCTPGESQALSSQLVELFLKGEVSRIELLYYQFQSSTQQVIVHETYLPFPVNHVGTSTASSRSGEDKSKLVPIDSYLLEPSLEALIEALLGQVLHSKIHTALLNNYASEQRARTVAMQMASENANEILEQLQLEYNKLRQQSITNELLDIVGGSFA